MATTKSTPKISGADLAKNFAAHVDALRSDIVALAVGEEVAKLEKANGGFHVTTKSGKEFFDQAVDICSVF